MTSFLSDRGSIETYIYTRNLTIQRAQQALELLASTDQAAFDVNMQEALNAYLTDARDQLFAVQQAAHDLWACEKDGDQPYNNIPSVDLQRQTVEQDRIAEQEIAAVQAAINESLPVEDIHQELEHIADEAELQQRIIVETVNVSSLNVARAHLRTMLTQFEDTMTVAYTLARSLNIIWNSAFIPQVAPLPDEYTAAA